MPYLRKKKSLKDKLFDWAGVAVIGAIVFAIAYLAISYELAIWAECRQDHSWFYCYRILNH